MGVKGRSFELQNQRDMDLYCVYKQMLADSPYPIYQPEVLRKTVTHSSKRFWVSSERATIVVSEMRRGNDLSFMNPCKRAMYEEIKKRVDALEKKTGETRLCILVEQVVCQPAPEFYLTPGSAKVILCRSKKRIYECFERKKRQLRFMF